MENSEHSFNAAWRDVRLNNAPYYRENGIYVWTQGQLGILSNAKHGQIRLDWNKLLHQQEQQIAILKEMLVYQSTSEKLKAEIDDTTARYNDLIEERCSANEALNNDLSQFEEGLRNRGIIFETKPAANKNEPGLFKKIFPAGTGKKIKSVLFFFISWAVGEIFMTAVSWQMLRNDNNIESILIRSMALGMVIFLIHVAAHLNNSRKKPIYIIFISFSLIMLLCMLFGPMVVNKIYPETDSQANSTQWSLTDTPVTTSAISQIQNPTWVEIYRGNEITVPAILCLVFFLAIMALNKDAGKSVEKEDNLGSEDTEIRRQRNQLIKQIDNGIKIAEELKQKKKEEVLKNTTELNNILKKLDESNKSVTEFDKQIAGLKTAIEVQLVLIEKELDQYKIDFQDILKNDQVKASFITPEWNSRQDILNFFKMK